MIRKQYIRSIAAFGLILLFALSITPRQVLHSVLAKHTDILPCSPAGKNSPTIFKSGFSCNIQHLVCESPFIDNAFQPVVEVPAVHTDSYQLPAYQFSSFTIQDHFLRGPPLFHNNSSRCQKALLLTA